MSKDTRLARDCAEHMFSNDVASQALGIRIENVRPGHAEAVMTVREDMLNGHAICHGGLIFTLADTAFAFACNTYNDVTVAAGASIDFMAPSRQGDRLRAIAAEQQRARRSGIYDVRVENQDGATVALFRGRSRSRREPLITDRV